MVEFEILEQKDKRLETKVIGADHTILNLLVKKLQQSKDVLLAAYNIEHPLVGSPKLIIETTKDTPKKAIEKAIADLKKENKAFAKALAAAF